MNAGAKVVLSVAVAAALVAGAALLVRRRTAAPAPARTTEARRPTWTAPEKRAIEDAVAAAAASSPPLALRPALDTDATDSDEHRDLDSVYGVYHPYFARGDIDGDGRLDFVQAFVEKKRSGAWFHVAAFLGRPDGSFEKPVWIEKAISLADGDVTVERSLVVITPDLGADPTRRWRWEPSEKMFVDPDAEPRRDPNTDEDAPEETPEQKPRARI